MKFKIMEQKKLDLNSIIGFILIFGILIWIMYQNQPTQKEIDARLCRSGITSPKLITSVESRKKSAKLGI